MRSDSVNKDAKIIAWILIVIILVCGYGWYSSEQKRLKVLEEKQALEDQIITLNNRIYDLESELNEL